MAMKSEVRTNFLSDHFIFCNSNFILESHGLIIRKSDFLTSLLDLNSNIEMTARSLVDTLTFLPAKSTVHDEDQPNRCSVQSHFIPYKIKKIVKHK